MSAPLLTEEELRAMRFVYSNRDVILRLLADLRRYRAWCRRLVACYEGEGDVLELAKEVKTALEDKP